MCICCNVVFSFVGQVGNSFFEADQLYSRWEKEWQRMTRTDLIYDGAAYYEQLWEDKIIGDAHEEYDSRMGGVENAGEASGQDSSLY